MNEKKLYFVSWGFIVLVAFILIPPSTYGSGIFAKVLYSLFFVGIPMAFLLPVIYLFAQLIWNIIAPLIRWIKK